MITKTFRITDLDCAHCAAKAERAVAKISGVYSANLNFMAQRLTVEFEGDEAAVIAEIRRAVKKVEPDCNVI